MNSLTLQLLQQCGNFSSSFKVVVNPKNKAVVVIILHTSRVHPRHNLKEYSTIDIMRTGLETL